MSLALAKITPAGIEPASRTPKPTPTTDQILYDAITRIDKLGHKVWKAMKVERFRLELLHPNRAKTINFDAWQKPHRELRNSLVELQIALSRPQPKRKQKASTRPRSIHAK